jgi:hypothetical protein
MAEPNGQNGSERLEGMERILETLVHEHVEFAAEHKQLLRAQVQLTDHVNTLAQAQKDTDERIGILIKMMDEWIRRHPEPPPA